MVSFRRIADRVVNWQYKRLARELSEKAPSEFVAAGERKLMRAFHRAASGVPSYAQLLLERNVDPHQIKTVDEFKEHVPIIDKASVFTANPLGRICHGGSLDGIAAVYSSSGHSSVFSFGVETNETISNGALYLEFLLDTYFDVTRRRTLLINCLPMGVRVNTRTVPVADTGVRADVILALVRKLAPEFQQFILVGESPFLKKVIEDGAEQQVPWHSLTIHVVTGGEFIAENFRSYLAHLLGIEIGAPDKGMILISMGLSELALSIFRECRQTIQLRRAIQTDQKLRSALIGDTPGACPEIMQYHPEHVYAETVADETGSPELVVSMLDPALKIPLMRYNTGDVVQMMGHDDLRQILQDFGQTALLPAFNLPVAFVWGRKQWVATPGGSRISPDEVKEALYREFDIARDLTGNFRLSQEGLLIQLKQGAQAPSDARDRLSVHLQHYIGAQVDVTLVPYDQFPHGLEHSYDKKNRYVIAE